MARRGITQNDVFNAALAIAEAGNFPTIQSVRAKIGSGSLVTIHKHLLAWKQERLLRPAVKIAPSKNAVKAKEVLAQKLELEDALKSQIEQNTTLSSKILEVEHTNAEQAEQITLLESQLRSLRTENHELQIKNSSHDEVIAELKNSYLEMLESVRSEKNVEIENLKAELKEVHLAALEMVRKTSADSQDALMNEKVKNINLEDKINVLNKQIAGLEKKLASNEKKDLKSSKDNKKAKVLKTYTLDEIYAEARAKNKKQDKGER